MARRPRLLSLGLIFALSMLTGCVDDREYEVYYRVVDSREFAIDVAITMQTPDGTEQHDIRMPSHQWDWRSSAFTLRDGDHAHISAQKQRGGPAHISVEIYVDGERVRQATTTGEYGIASVSWGAGVE